MKKITLLLVLSFVLFNVSFAQTVSFGQSKIQNLSNIHKRVKIDLKTPKLFEKLDNSGIDLACGVYFTETYIQIELSEYEISRITENGVPYTVLIDDMTKFYADRAAKDMPLAQLELLKEKEITRSNTLASKSSSVKSTVIKNIGQHDDCSEITWNTPLNFTVPTTFGGCLTYSGVAAELDKMRTLYPNLISVKANASPTNQLTHEGRTIYVVKISDNPDTNESEPQSLTTGMTHSREVSSLMNQIFYMWYLLENYNSDPFIKNLVDNTELYFIPVVNPDGLAWNETIAPTGGGLQRKNLRAGVCNPGGTASTNNSRGVDINRNFGYQYGLTGSSSVQCDPDYRGTAAFSEPETQVIRDFILAKNIKTALNHHAYSNLLPHPVNGKASTPTGRENEFAKFCHDMTQYNRYVYGPAPSILYAASGDASDWMAGGAVDANGSTGSGKNVLAVSPENGAVSGEGQFWPSPTLISTIAKRAMRMNFINSYYCGKYAKLHDLTQSNISSLNSNLTFGIERLGQTASNYTLTVTPVSTNIVSITSPAVQTGMTILEQRNVTSSLILSPSILANQKIEYKVTLSNGDYTLYEANFVKIYNPTVLFNNNPDVDLLTKWTTTGGTWVNSTSAYSGSSSITDASTVAYANSVNKSIATTNSINLSGAQKVLVQYYAKWDLERNFDLVQIQGSTNGTTWTTLCGNYTKPTSTTATNPHATKSANSNIQSTNGGGTVLYDGDTRGKWAMEEIVIDASNNSFLVGATTAKFRFRLITDNSNAADLYNTTFEGFYFDDFRVIKQISEPPVAICKNATLALGVGGTLTVLATDVNNGSTDDIGITSLSVSPNTFNCTHRNTTQNVTLTVTDGDGQTSSCVATVTITDANPLVGTVSANQTICTGTQPANITISGSTGTIQWQSSTDNINFSNISGQTSSTLSGSAIGTLTATRYYRAVITNGNCSTSLNSNSVTVFVTPNPTIGTISPNTAVSGGSTFTLTVNGTNFINSQSIVRWNGTNRTTNYISATQLTASISASDIASSGTANVTVFNSCNSTTTSNQVFTINSGCSNPVPNIASLPNINVQCSVTVTAPTATSNCYGTITGTTNNPTTYNSQGTFVINWTYNDGNGHISTQQQFVYINDTTEPIPNVTNLPSLTAQCSLTVTPPTATDNCMGTVIASTFDPLTYNTQGTYSIIWEYIDNRGNQNFQQQNVVIDDTVAPVANVASLPTVNGQCSATVTAPTATDACTGQITGTTTDATTYTTQGTFTVTWTYNDGNGNSSTQTQNIIISNGGTVVTFYQDLDGDTFGNPNASTQDCSQPVGYVLDNSDCNNNQIQYADVDNDGFGSTTQVACGVTNNTDCNDNDETQNVLITFYQDFDGDTFGNPNASTQDCSQPVGYVLDNSDCNDNQIQYADVDNDGFGSTTQVACGVTNNTDCNDNDENQNVLITFYQDFDGDTFGNPNVTIQACSQPFGYVTSNTDCDDNNASSTALISYYQDLDGDGFGNPLVVIQNCSQPVGYVSSNTDCDDTRASVHPGAIDICYDGLDNDCNGIIDNNCTPIVSTVPTASCGSTVSGLSTSIYATIVSGAQGYRFKITNTATGTIQIFDRPVNNLAFSAIPGVTYNTQYQVEIGVKYSNVWQPFYGTPCFVNTPSPTSTVGAQCGTTLTAMNQWVNATYVASISAYRFRVTNTITSEVQVLTTSMNKFNMTQLANRSYNTTYLVEVALRNTDGTFLSYGLGCNITTPFFPTTKLRDDKCGYVVYNVNELLPANVVSGATAYRFRIYNTSLGFERILTRATTSFSLSLVSGLITGTPYKVQVSVQIKNEFGPYGEDCNISLPGIVDRASENKNEETLNASVVPNPFSSVFNIKLENNSSENITISVYDLTGRMLENKTIQSSDKQSFSFGENYPSGVYNLILSQGDHIKSLRIIKR